MDSLAKLGFPWFSQTFRWFYERCPKHPSRAHRDLKVRGQEHVAGAAHAENIWELGSFEGGRPGMDAVQICARRWWLPRFEDPGMTLVAHLHHLHLTSLTTSCWPSACVPTNCHKKNLDPCATFAFSQVSWRTNGISFTLIRWEVYLGNNPIFLVCSDPQDLRHGHQGIQTVSPFLFGGDLGRGHGQNDDGVNPSGVPMDHACNFFLLQVWFIKFGSVSFQI